MTSVRKLARLTTVFLLIAGAQRLASGSPLEEDWQSFELAQASSASSSSGLPFARIETGATIRGGHTEFWGEFLAYLAESLQSELQRKRLAEALSRVRSVVEADRQGSYWMLIDLFELQSESVTHRRTVAIYLLKGKTLQEAMVSFYREPSLKPEPPENFRYAPLVQRIVASGPDYIATFPIPTQLVKKTIREAKARIDIESRLGEVNQAIGEISDELGKITGKSADQLTVADIKGLQTLKEHALLSWRQIAIDLQKEAHEIFESILKLPSNDWDSYMVLDDLLAPYQLKVKEVDGILRGIDDWERTAYQSILEELTLLQLSAEMNVINFIESLDAYNTNLTYVESLEKSRRIESNLNIIEILHYPQIKLLEKSDLMRMLGTEIGKDWRADSRELLKRHRQLYANYHSTAGFVTRHAETTWPEARTIARSLGVSIESTDTFNDVADKNSSTIARIERASEETKRWKQDVIEKARTVGLHLDADASVGELNGYVDEINKRVRAKAVREQVEERLKDLRAHGIYISLNLGAGDSAETIIRKFEAAKARELQAQRQELQRIRLELEAKERERQRQRRLEPGTYFVDRHGSRPEPEEDEPPKIKKPGKGIVILGEPTITVPND